MNSLTINSERLLNSLRELGQIGALPGGGVNRLALTDADRAGRDWVVARMQALGMTVAIDAIGNILGDYAGTEPHLPPVMTGSHIDTVRTGGLYDGNYGVLAGLEVVAALRDAGHRPRRSLRVAVFTNEEGARFQPDMLGSLVHVGGLPLATALDACAADGTRLGDELERIGYAGNTPVGAPQVDHFVELHIEQGPVLHREGTPIGVVEGVQGIAWTEFTLQGTSNHAGTTPMALRQDAGYVAACIATFARELTQRHSGQLGTVGSLTLTPNLINVIAQRAVLTVDLRNTDGATLAQAQRELMAYAQKVAATENVTVSHRSLADFAPVAFDPNTVQMVEDEARALGLTTRRMPSGAGHDAQMLARVCPTAMIFVPSVDGLSHNVREHTEPDHLAQGAQILLNVLLKLADRPT